MKKIIFILVLIVTLSLTSCQQNQVTKKQNMRDEFSYQAMSSISMLNQNGSNLTKTKNISFVDSTEDIEDILYQVDMMNDNQKRYEMVPLESDRNDFKYLQKISFIDFFNTEYQYKLYYNDIYEKTKHEVDDEQDENETKIKYQGIAIIEEKEYSFDFVSEQSQEENESEVETKFTIYTGENSYIFVKTEQESEQNEIETKYRHRIVDSGKITLDYTLKREVEQNEMKIKIEYNGEKIKIKKYMINSETYFDVSTVNENYCFKRMVKEDNIVSYILIEKKVNF